MQVCPATDNTFNVCKLNNLNALKGCESMANVVKDHKLHSWSHFYSFNVEKKETYIKEDL